MKTKWILILLTLSLFSFVTTDYKLSFYGKGYNLLKNKIVYDFNTDFDNLEGFKIEEEGFIQIIGHGTKINNDIMVNKITDYTYNSNGIFCNITDNKKEKHFVKVSYNKDEESTNKIKFSIISEDKLNKDLTWYNVSDSQLLKILELSNIALKLLLFLCAIFLGISLYRKGKQR